MIRIGILGDIGAGKSYVAKNFGYPIFDADQEVSKLYKSDQKIFNKLKKKLPKFIYSLPIDKKEITNAILTNKKNLDVIIKIIHFEIRKKLSIFLKKNKKVNIVILDIPLLLENKINDKKDILIFVESKKRQILKRLKKRKNFNEVLLRKFKSIQLPASYKKKKSQFIIRNDFTKKTVMNRIKSILKKLQK
jgi:dephospho-CoA kinase